MLIYENLNSLTWNLNILYSFCSSLQLNPFHIPDLLSGSPLFVSGRYQGNFPDSVKARGILADMSNFIIDVKVQRTKDIPLDRVMFQLLNLAPF